jgi:hypothetical protein
MSDLGEYPQEDPVSEPVAPEVRVEEARWPGEDSFA